MSENQLNSDNQMIQDLFAKATGEIEKVVYGQTGVIRFCLAGLLSGGHVLIEGVPGTAKTTIVRALGSVLNLSFSRIQFTPDLLPNDITGSFVYRSKTDLFEFRKGPVFANFVLADEINRAPAKSQAALLEAMQEGTVTQEGNVHSLPVPFTVFATQNPVDHEGTYPLPQAQLDRFMFKVLIGYPEKEAEETMLNEHHTSGGQGGDVMAALQKVTDAGQILAAREAINATFVRPEVISYVRDLIAETRKSSGLLLGASPRAGLMLLLGAKSLARFEGRDFVTPDDIKSAFMPSLRHRVVLSPSVELEGSTSDDILRQVLSLVEVPR